MFPLSVIVTLIICAVPLCLAIALGLVFSGVSTAVAATVGVGLFLASTSFISMQLVVANTRKSS